VASDLLSQAEHGPDSQVVLLTVNLSSHAIQAIQDQVTKQAELLPRRDIVRQSLSKSYILSCSNLDEAIQFSNAYAPEHLILHLENPREVLPKISNAGSVFLGPYSAERYKKKFCIPMLLINDSCGDYASGTNHTLPTYGISVRNEN
jgi:phosphoribosyl-ATP pyrophosphohydrolase/phosphoribosyl-AMP cyclohydrolase/histidinol dehydrogenase